MSVRAGLIVEWQCCECGRSNAPDGKYEVVVRDYPSPHMLNACKDCVGIARRTRGLPEENESDAQAGSAERAADSGRRGRSTAPVKPDEDAEREVGEPEAESTPEPGVDAKSKGAKRIAKPKAKGGKKAR